MTETDWSYLPAAGASWALPLYDPFVKLMGIERAKKSLLQQAGFRSSQRVLDIGCGTGTMAVLIKRNWPGVEVTGLDPDPSALALAGQQSSASSGECSLRTGVRGPHAAMPMSRSIACFRFSCIITFALRIGTTCFVKSVAF